MVGGGRVAQAAFPHKDLGVPYIPTRRHKPEAQTHSAAPYTCHAPSLRTARLAPECRVTAAR
jgi:hypothetical protein